MAAPGHESRHQEDALSFQSHKNQKAVSRNNESIWDNTRKEQALRALTAAAM